MNALPNKSLLLALAVAGVSATAAEAPKAVVPPPRSVFIQPAGPQEGRDPFFPESIRPYQDTTPAAVAKREPDASAFSVKGLSVDHGRPMVIINNHTFAVGEEGDVAIPGGHAHIRVRAIHDNQVAIEYGGVILNLVVTNKQPL